MTPATTSMWRVALLIAACFVIAGSISAVVVYAVVDSEKADIEPVEANSDRIDTTEENAKTAKALASDLDVLVERLRERAATLFAYVKGQEPIPGAPGADGLPSNIPGEDGTDGADSTVPGPAGDDGNDGADSTVPGPTGATGLEGPQGPPPTAAEIMAAVSDYFASADGREQIRQLINDLGCVAPPPDHIVTCP